MQDYFTQIRRRGAYMSRLSPLQRLLRHVIHTGDCWIWTGKTDSRGRYGRTFTGFHSDNTLRDLGAHQLSWEIHFGPVPIGLEVCHRCDVPLCVNPDHLFLDTRKGNMEDAARKGRINKGEGCHNARVSEGQVSEIRRLYAAGGVTQHQLATRFGITQGTVWAIVSRKTWRHVP